MRCLLLVGLAGCMPYAVPPLTGNLAAVRATGPGARTGVHVEAGFAPLQLTRSQLLRRWDGTVSGSFERAAHDTWGAAIAAGPVLHPWGTNEAEVANRLAPQLVGRWTTDGPAVGARVDLERVGFRHWSGDTKNAVGSAHGEVGAGVFLELSYQPGDLRDVTSVLVGIKLRVPALAGIACCISP